MGLDQRSAQGWLAVELSIKDRRICLQNLRNRDCCDQQVEHIGSSSTARKVPQGSEHSQGVSGCQGGIDLRLEPALFPQGPGREKES